MVGTAELPPVITPVFTASRGRAGWLFAISIFNGWNVSFTFGSSASTCRIFGLGASILGAKYLATSSFGTVFTTGEGGGSTFTFATFTGGGLGAGGVGISSGGP